ncbi:MAG: hypothetical protein ACQESR_12885 [Planctomycetota bacterium]
MGVCISRRKLLIVAVGAILLITVGIPLASVLYKYFSRFYAFRDAVETKIVPGWTGRQERLTVPRNTDREVSACGSLSLFSDWSPTAIQEDGLDHRERFQLSPADGGNVELTLFPLLSFKDLSVVEEHIFVVAEEAYGGWRAFALEYDNDRHMLESIVCTELPAYLHLSSAQQGHSSITEYLFRPLFPQRRDYQKEYAPLAMKAILVHNDSIKLGCGTNLYFVVVEDNEEKLARIFFGVIHSGDLLGDAVLEASEDTEWDDELLRDICQCMDRSPGLLNWELRERRDTKLGDSLRRANTTGDL